MKPTKLGKLQVVDMATSQVVSEQANAMVMLPPKGDVCQECAIHHAWDQPHDRQSLHYQYHFHARHARWPTWTDAMAHGPEPVRASWRRELRGHYEKLLLEIPEDLRDDTNEPRTR